MTKKPAKERYEELKTKRLPFLNRARECAALTIPSLLPPEGHSQYNAIPETYQSVGARGVTNLANKIMMAMYPPGLPSFKLDIPAEVLAESGQMEADKDTQRYLTMTETLITSEIERLYWRNPTHLALQYLIVGGNYLEQMLNTGQVRIFRMDQYVTVRNDLGEMVEFLIEERLNPAGLTERQKAAAGPVSDSQDHVPMYTHGRLEKGTWTVYQSINDTVIKDSSGTFEANKLPYNALTWTRVLGEDYGRGMCEENIGDLRAVDGMSESMVAGAAIAGRHLITVRPGAAGGGVNLKRKIVKGSNGDVVICDHEDIGMLTFDNVSGMQLVQAELREKINDLKEAFLMNTAVQRDAERVTAFEVQKVIEELEGALGGVYSMLAQNLQTSRLRRLMHLMQARKALPDQLADLTQPTILTGLEALGREQEVGRAVQGIQVTAQIPPEVSQDYIKWSELLGKIYNGLNLAGVVATEQEASQRREQRLQAEAQAMLAEQAAKQQGGEGV